VSARTARRKDDASTSEARDSEHEFDPGEESDVGPDEDDEGEDDLDDPFLDGDDFDESALVDDLEPSGSESEDDEGDADDESSEDLDEAIAAEDEGDEEETTGVAVVPPEAEFDDDAPVASVDDEDDDEEIEGVRDGEFVCRSCFMAKRDTQLADADRLLCRDCA